MFYFIALAGAHKRVVIQLREQLNLVRKLRSWGSGPGTFMAGHRKEWGASPRKREGRFHHHFPRTLPSGPDSWSSVFRSWRHPCLQHMHPHTVLGCKGEEGRQDCSVAKGKKIHSDCNHCCKDGIDELFRGAWWTIGCWDSSHLSWKWRQSRDLTDEK